ncbi:hypothetical protein [Streptomyces sp. NEAU-YJ-81]|nr:hypothetical protein [Streptomyces sp. NEAU-YJ-81]
MPKTGWGMLNLDGLREQANRLIEQSMSEWQRVSQGDAPEG